MKRILGIDPGSRITGYGIIDVEGNQRRYIGCGFIKTKGPSAPLRLAEIFEELQKIIHTYRPSQMAIERVFMHKNPDSAIKLGQARGAAICACMTEGLHVHEFSATEIKNTIVGKGHATKDQVQYMIKRLLKINVELQEDSADGLAIAFCLASHLGTAELMRKKR